MPTERVTLPALPALPALLARAAWSHRVVHRRPAGHDLRADGADDCDGGHDDQPGDQRVLQHLTALIVRPHAFREILEFADHDRSPWPMPIIPSPGSPHAARR